MGMTEGPCLVTLRVVRGGSQTDHCVEVDLSAPVWNLKQELQSVVGIPQVLQLWAIQGQELDDEGILGQFVREAGVVIEVRQDDEGAVFYHLT